MIKRRLLTESFRSIWAQRARSFLTSLGIIIGAATIIMVIDFGEGAKADIARQYSNLSVTTIFVNAPSNSDSGASQLSYEDSVAIQKAATHVSTVAPVLSGKVTVVAGAESEQYTVAGTTAAFEQLSHLTYVRGGFFTDEQDKAKKKVVVLGSTVAETLFGTNTASAMGQTITINKKSYEVVGVITERGGSFGPLTIDESVFMPFKTADKYALASGGKMNLNASANDLASIQLAMEEIGVILRKEHNIKPGGADDFKLKDMGSNVVAAKESAQTMAILLSAVAVIVLVVGGIGIMNVMYINVTERTKEIGLRKALGAKKKHILSQFLIEALVISLAGSVLGVVLGLAVYPIAANAGLKVVHAWWGVGVALLFSVSIGVFFGYYPARKAANLNPIEALRYE